MPTINVYAYAYDMGMSMAVGVPAAILKPWHFLYKMNRPQFAVLEPAVPHGAMRLGGYSHLQVPAVVIFKS